MTFQRSLVFSSIAALLYGGGAFAQVDKTEETIQVLGNKHHNAGAPAGKSEFLSSEDFSPHVTNISELVADTPGAELSGQGGLFQVYSLRGMSRWRVLTQIGGVPIHTERRAGTAASFISPWLIGHVEVLKGPVSTLYGSGGMAGLTQITPKHFDGLEMETGFSTNGQAQFESFGWGNEQYSLGLNHRKEKNGRTPQGQAVNNHFEQLSASFIGDWTLTKDIDSQLQLIYSKGNDIGKANNEDFESKKYTVYPDEKHLLAQFALLSDDDWQARASIHKQQLSTQTIRFGKRVNTAQTQATDYALNLLKTWQLSEIDGQWGLEQEYRDNIRANEKEVSLRSDDFSTNEFLNASQYNAALFGNINYRLNDWSFTVGARANYIKQASGYDLPGHEDRSDSAATYFLAAACQLAPEWRLNSSVSTGFRFPTVTERFYNGMTARGQTFGNPDLKPETARNLELGLSYNQDDYGFELNVFSNRISDYIERINLDQDIQTYRNLSAGTIKGLEFGFNHQLTDSFNYELSGHHLNGEDENGNPIGDISPNKLQLALNYLHNHWQARLKLKHRFAHNKVASGEQTLEAVDILTGDISYQLTENLKLTLWADNLLDSAYTLTSDKKSAFATERQYGLTLSWQME